MDACITFLGIFHSWTFERWNIHNGWECDVCTWWTERFPHQRSCFTCCCFCKNRKTGKKIIQKARICYYQTTRLRNMPPLPSAGNVSAVTGGAFLHVRNIQNYWARTFSRHDKFGFRCVFSTTYSLEAKAVEATSFQGILKPSYIKINMFKFYKYS